MNQNVKTIVFAATAVVVVVLAIVLQPGAPDQEAAPDLGRPLFPQFTDPLAAAALQIVSYDEATGDRNEFRVEQKDGLWVIPSHDNYPANAKDQMAGAAGAIIGLRKLRFISADKEDQSKYGVRDPRAAEAGQKDFGIYIAASDKDGAELAEMIVGGTVEGNDKQRYVRLPGEDRIYVTDIDTDDLTTDFNEWIERNFLDLEVDDIARIVVNDYSIDEARGALLQGEKIDLKHKRWGDPEWSLADDSLPQDMMLDKDRLGKLRDGVRDLRIVDVERKHELLASNLRRGKEFFPDLNNPANGAVRQLLQEKGFYAMAEKDGEEIRPVVVSNLGEIVVGMNDGVEYVLRFGEITGEDVSSPITKDGQTEPSGTGDEQKKDDNAAAGDGGGANSNRYIYVVARVNEDLLVKPDLKPIPDFVPPAKPAPDEPSQDKPAEDQPADDQPAEDKPADDQPAAGDGDAAGGPDGAAKPSDDRQPAADGANEPDATDKPAPDDARADDDAALERARKEHEARIAEIKAENEKLQKEFDEKVDKAAKRVKDLNSRFADWFYIIPDSAFTGVRITRAEIIKPDEAALALKKADAFLEKNKTAEGVKTTESGLQYQVLASGQGATPKADDQAEVRYKGTLLDGTVFDQTEGDAVAEFGVGGVIKGWSEALQLMKEGDKWRLWIPPAIGYGPDGSGEKIGPNELLIFEVELVKVKPKG